MLARPSAMPGSAGPGDALEGGWPRTQLTGLVLLEAMGRSSGWSPPGGAGARAHRRHAMGARRRTRGVDTTGVTELITAIGAIAAVGVLAVLAVGEFLRASSRSDARARVGSLRLLLVPLLVIFGFAAILGLQDLVPPAPPGATSTAAAGGSGSPPPPSSPSVTASPTPDLTAPPSTASDPTSPEPSSPGPSSPDPSSRPPITAVGEDVPADHTCADTDPEWRSLTLGAGLLGEGLFSDLVTQVTISRLSTTTIDFETASALGAVIISGARQGRRYLLAADDSGASGLTASGTPEAAPPIVQVAFCYGPPEDV